MKKIFEIEKILDDHQSIKTDLEKIVQYSIENKKLVFDETCLGIDMNQFDVFKAFEKKGNRYWLEDEYGCFSYLFMKSYSDKSFNQCHSFKEKAQQLNQIIDHFNEDHRIQNYHNLEEGLWKFCIVKANDEVSENYIGYLNTIDKEKDQQELYDFCKGYINTVNSLDLSVDEYCDNALKLYDLLYEDGVLNTTISQLLLEVRNKAFHNENDFGFKCYEYLINKSNDTSNVLIPIISAIYDIQGKSFYTKQLSNELTDDFKQIAIICGLSNIKKVGKVEAELFLTLIDKCDDTSSIRIQKPRLLFAIIESEHIEESSSYITDSFDFLMKLACIEDKILKRYIMQECYYGKRFSDKYFDLLLNIVNQKHYSVKEDLGQIEHYFYRNISCDRFIRIVEAICSKKGFYNIYKQLSHSINELIQNDKVNFDNYLTLLITSNSARKRYIGHDILNNLRFERAYVFGNNLLELDHITQYKFWFSLCIFYKEPKLVIPSFSPLLESESELIKESVICKIEEYSENYGHEVIDVLKSYNGKDGIFIDSVIQRVNMHYETHIETERAEKVDVYELNPYYTQGEFISDFNQCFRRKTSNTLSKSQKDEGFFSNMFKSTTLLKGGGLKMPDRDEILKLNSYTSSVSISRDHYIYPEEDDYNTTLEVNNDWDDNKFMFVKEALKNEQQ